jgi:hypothetical protein
LQPFAEDLFWIQIEDFVDVFNRLYIISDATVGPALNQYITQCVQYSVQGFESDRWAVRNSSMMVFTAVVQRSVDVDKNDSGGSSAGALTLDS